MINVATLIRTAVFLLFVSAVLNSSFAQTPKPKQTAQGILTALDKNGDGKITKEEAPDQVKTYFDSIDSNSDGAIDLKEAKVMADYANDQKSGQEKTSETKVDDSEAATAESLIKLLDKDGDGKISKKESAGPLKSYFASIDSNQDGFIALKEARGALEYSKQNGNVVMIGDFKNGSKPGRNSQGESSEELSPQEIVIAMDKNGDGKISKGEAPEDLVLFFGNYDANADGMIDKKESEAIVDFLQASRATPVAKKASAEKVTAEKVTAQSLMKILDSNGDGKITKAEAPQQLKDSFGYVDTNNDGVIDVAEAQAMADYQNQKK